MLAVTQIGVLLSQISWFESLEFLKPFQLRLLDALHWALCELEARHPEAYSIAYANQAEFDRRLRGRSAADDRDSGLDSL